MKKTLTVLSMIGFLGFFGCGGGESTDSVSSKGDVVANTGNAGDPASSATLSVKISTDNMGNSGEVDLTLDSDSGIETIGVYKKSGPQTITFTTKLNMNEQYHFYKTLSNGVTCSNIGDTFGVVTELGNTVISDFTCWN